MLVVYRLKKTWILPAHLCFWPCVDVSVCDDCSVGLACVGATAFQRTHARFHFLCGSAAFQFVVVFLLLFLKKTDFWTCGHRCFICLYFVNDAGFFSTVASGFCTVDPLCALDRVRVYSQSSFYHSELEKVGPLCL